MLASCIRQNHSKNSPSTGGTPDRATPEKATPFSVAQNLAPIHKENVQAIINRDFVLPIDLEYSEIVALQRAFFPEISMDLNLISEPDMTEDICGK